MNNILEAQEFKFDGYINSGLGFWFTDDNDEDHQLMVYGVDSERNVGRFRLNGAFTNEAKNAGANFRIQAQGRGKSNGEVNALALAFGYAWVKPFEMLNIKAGLVDDSTFRTGDVLLNDSLSEGVGVLFKLTPIKNLDIGAGAYAATYGGSSDNNFIPRIESQLDLEDGKYTFNVAYTMDKVFRMMAGYRTENNTGGDSKYNPSEFLAELRLLAVNNLSAVLVAQIHNVNSNDEIDKGIRFYESFNYKYNDLIFGLNAAQYLITRVDSTKSDDFSLQINPWISYSFNDGKIVPRMDFVYFLGGELNGVNYHRRGLQPSYNSDDSIINIRPSVKFNMDSRNNFEIGNSFYYAAESEKITNVFYLDFVVRF
jgi:hypothetical protein